MAGFKKTECKVSRSDFAKDAKPVEVKINGQTFYVDPKEFSTGSLGWYLNGKVSIEINGVKHPCQVGMNLTLVGSKELPKEGQQTAAA